MLKWLRIRKLKTSLNDDFVMLKHMISRTNHLKESLVVEVGWVVRDQRLEWSRAIKDPEVSNLLFQFLLHKQFIGFLAENMRRNYRDLLEIDKKLSKATGFAKAHKGDFLEAYRILVENVIAEHEMKILCEQLFEEMLPELKAFDQD